MRESTKATIELIRIRVKEGLLTHLSVEEGRDLLEAWDELCVGDSRPEEAPTAVESAALVDSSSTGKTKAGSKAAKKQKGK